jgi:fibronectin-binding autotransporter adhesin
MKRHVLLGRLGISTSVFIAAASPVQAQTTTWVGGVTGSWHLGTNWSTGNEPEVGTNVTVGTGVSLTYNMGDSPVLNSVSLARSLELSGGILTTSLLNLNAGGSLKMDGGTLKDATISNNSLVTFTNTNSVFDAVTLAAGQPLSIGTTTNSGRLVVKNNLQYSNNQVFNLGINSNLYFDGANNIFDNATVNNLEDTNYTYIGVNGSNQSLTLGSNLNIAAAKYLFLYDQGYANTILNNNTSLISSQGGSWHASFKDINNTGLIGSNGTSSNLTFATDALLNNQAGGEIRASNGGVVGIYNATNLGKVRAIDTDSRVDLLGNYTTAQLSDVKSSNNGTISITNAGVLDNTGTTLDVATINGNGSGKFQLSGGKILGGTIQNSQQLSFTNTSNRLDGVTLAPGQGLNIGNVSTAGNAVIQNGITYSGNPTFNLGIASSLYFDGANNIFDNATVNNLEDTNYTYIGVNGSNQSLTLGSNLNIAAAKYLFLYDQGYTNTTLINNASLISSQGGSWYLVLKNINNTGLIGSNGAGSTLIFSADALLNNQAGGEIRASNGGVVGIYNATNLGKIRATDANSKVGLFGTYTTAQLSDVKSSNNGTISITNAGALNNTGATLDVATINGNGSGKFQLDIGKIVGGTIQNSQQLGFTASTSNILDGVTLAPGQGLNIGDVATTGTVVIQNGITYSGNPTFNLGINSGLYFDGASSIFDNATLNATDNTNYTFIGVNSNNQSLTLGANLVVNPTKYLYFYSQGYTNTGLPNNTILTTGQDATWFINASKFTNTDTLNVLGNSNLTIDTNTSATNAGNINIGSGSIIKLSTNATTGTTQTGGQTTVNGTLDVATATVPTTPLTLNGGVLKGTGNIIGAVINNGATVAPGNSPGTLNINGSYAQAAGGILEMEFAGLGAGQFDVLNVTGNATLDGLLTANLSYNPIDGQEFTIIQTTNGITGNFSAVQTNYPSYTALFSVFNNNGILKFSAISVIPEPGTLALLLVGASAFAWRRRRARRA